MANITQSIIDIIQQRKTSRVKALEALSSSPLDNLSDEVKIMREVEAGKIRSVMQEQTDLIQIFNI